MRVIEPIGRIEVADGPSGPIVHVLGEVDLTNAKSLEVQIVEAVGDASPVVLDLSGVEYLDSAGLALIYRLSRSLEAGLRLVAAEDALVRRTLDVAGLEVAGETAGFPPVPREASRTRVPPGSRTGSQDSIV